MSPEVVIESIFVALLILQLIANREPKRDTKSHCDL